MAYVDGFVIPVPSGKKEAYLRVAERAAPIFKEFGAERVVECWGEDVPEGKVTSFPMAVKCQPGETVVFSWIIWPSREVRDEGMRKFMEDPRMKDCMSDMPFDGQRMIFGGFTVLLDV